MGAQHGTLDDGVHQTVLVVADDDHGLIWAREVLQPLHALNAVESVDARLDEVNRRPITKMTPLDGRFHKSVSLFRHFGSMLISELGAGCLNDAIENALNALFDALFVQGFFSSCKTKETAYDTLPGSRFLPS